MKILNNFNSSDFNLEEWLKEAKTKYVK